MTKEELIKDNYPNDEFLQSGVLQIVDKCTAELEKAYNETEELLDKQTEETYKLFKENTELKKQQFSLRNERNTLLAQNEQYEKDLIDFNEKLTKAKAIIEELIELGKIWLSEEDDDYSFISEAEQFLKGKL